MPCTLIRLGILQLFVRLKKPTKRGARQIWNKHNFLKALLCTTLPTLFSTGHLREPRRTLYRTWTDKPNGPYLPEGWPADRCAQRQHDEDCANGLWLQNLRGDAWPAYGDKQLFAGKSSKNLERAVDALQNGIWEIRSTYKNGTTPHTRDTEALRRVRSAFWGQSTHYVDYRRRLQYLKIWIDPLILFRFSDITPTFRARCFWEDICLSAMILS